MKDPSDVWTDPGVAVPSATVTSAASIFPSIGTSDIWNEAVVAVLSVVLTSGASAFPLVDTSDLGDDADIWDPSTTPMTFTFSFSVNVDLQLLESQWRKKVLSWKVCSGFCDYY